MSKFVRRLVGESQYSKFKPLGHRFDYLWWIVRGKPVRSPHLLKQMTVAEHGRRYQLRTLVETGTYYGEMIAPMRKCFDRIYSIELNPELAESTRQRYAHDPSITVLQGDSQVLVPQVVAQLDKPALFWLDAWYYGYGENKNKGDLTRLLTELRAILSSPIKEHIVLIDDARTFFGTKDKFTAAELVAWIENTFPERKAEIARDIFRITRR
jgi:hypothetical protein